MAADENLRKAEMFSVQYEEFEITCRYKWTLHYNYN